MAVAHLVTRGFGNGTLTGDINLVVTRGYAVGEEAATVAGGFPKKKRKYYGTDPVTEALRQLEREIEKKEQPKEKVVYLVPNKFGPEIIQEPEIIERPVLIPLYDEALIAQAQRDQEAADIMLLLLAV